MVLCAMEKKWHLKEIAPQLHLVLIDKMGNCYESSKLICIYIHKELFRAETWVNRAECGSDVLILFWYWFTAVNSPLISNEWLLPHRRGWAEMNSADEPLWHVLAFELQKEQIPQLCKGAFSCSSNWRPGDTWRPCWSCAGGFGVFALLYI